MRNIKRAILLIALLMLALTLVACNGDAMDGIRFEKSPKTTYVQGQELNFDNAVLVALKGGQTENVAIADATVSGYDKNVLGKQTVTVTYNGKSTSFEVNVVPRISVEGAVTDYFVGDSLDVTKGRIVVMNDNGVATPIPLNDSRITFSGFDATAAGNGKTVTVNYADYSGSFTVNVHDVASVELTARPKKTSYASHETEFDVAGAYFTVKSADGKLEKYVELTAATIIGFDPAAATEANIDTPLVQKIKIVYLGHEFDGFEISVTYSGVDYVKDCAAALAGLSDPAAATKEQGEAALKAMSAYLELTGSDKKLVDDKDKEFVAKVAVISGYDRFKNEVKSFSDTFELSSGYNETDGHFGAFKITASTYESSVTNLARLKNDEDPLISLCGLLGKIEKDFAELEIADGKNADEYMDVLCDEEGLGLVRGILELMTGLYDDLKGVPVDWKRENVEEYASAIRSAVVRINGSEFKAYGDIPYYEFFAQMSSWREKNDYFDIIYAYYYEVEEDHGLSTLWDVVPFPGELNTVYLMIAYGREEAMSMKVGSDTSEFLYYYHNARKMADQIMNGDNQLRKDIFKAFGFESDMNEMFFIGDIDEINKIAYVYHVSSLIGNEQYEAFEAKYMELMALMNADSTLDYTSEVVQDASAELLRAYMEFTPAQRYAILCAIHCDYRYREMDDMVLAYKFNDKGDLVTYNWFAGFVIRSYREILADEETFDLFCDMLCAMELYGLRYNNDENLDKFKTDMADIKARAEKLGSAKLEPFAFLYSELLTLYSECTTPANPNVDAYRDRINTLIGYINVFYDISHTVESEEMPEGERLQMVTLMLGIGEKIFDLADELLGEGNGDLNYDFLHTLYSFNVYEDDEKTEMESTLDFMLDSVRSNHALTLLSSSVSLQGEDGQSKDHNAYNVYHNSAIGEFLGDAIEIMYATYSNQISSLDPEYVLSVMKSFRELDEDTVVAFISFSGSTLYYNGIVMLFANGLDDASLSVLQGLMMAEEYYASYITEKGDVTLNAFIAAMELVDNSIKALEDPSVLRDEFIEMYNYYMAKYAELKA